VKYKTCWYFPKGETCLKISSNADVRFSFLDEILAAITPEQWEKKRKKKFRKRRNAYHNDGCIAAYNAMCFLLRALWMKSTCSLAT